MRPAALGFWVGLAACSSASTSAPSASNAPETNVTGASEGEDPGAFAPTPTLPVDSTIPTGQRLLAEVQRILGTELHTVYQHTTNVDASTHTYYVDCSGFVDYAMSRAAPAPFAALQKGTVTRPLARSYVEFISALPARASVGWRRVERARDLTPGDIVAWLRPADVATTNTGHVMVVGGAVAAFAGLVHVPVIDATETGHGATDARTVSRTTGVGQGTIALVVDSSGAPTGYRWSTEESSLPHTTTVVLAHLD